MRVLFSAGLGMPALLRMVPLAQALLAAGHEVRFCCPARARHRVARAGLVPVLATPSQFSRAWRPELVVHDPLCPDSTTMAAESGAPTVGYLPYAHPPLPPRPTVWIDDCPPPLRERPRPDAWAVRCDAYELPGEAPRWLAGPPLRPRVCVVGDAAYGSTPEDRQRAELFRRAAEGADSLGLELLVLAGRDQPWSRLLPGCAAVVHAGDEGTVYAAARFGVPQLVLPAGEAERRVAERIERVGIGRCLAEEEMAGDPSALRLRFHVAELVHGGRALPTATALSRTVAELTPPGDLVPRLEALVR
ncbi:glycosyltransferase [Streptomyces sp. NPDC001595]|uniref:glycosyltransferase n=1 Tax=Streptomyces sp. NPDC001532 TaxID=3154520 RepID=UPI003326633D